MGSFYQEFPLESGNFNLLTPGDVDEISKGLNHDYFGEPSSSHTTVKNSLLSSGLTETLSYENKQCVEYQIISGNWCLVNPRNLNEVLTGFENENASENYAPDSSHNIVNNFPSSSGITKNIVHRNDQCYEFQMVSGNWCLVNPMNLNGIGNGSEEEIVCEYNLPNDETSIYEYPLDSGNWFLLTPSDTDEIKSVLEDVSPNENCSFNENQRKSSPSIRSLESFESGNWYAVTSSDVNEINRCLVETNSAEPTSLHIRGKSFNPSLGLLEKIAARYRKISEFPWVDEYFDEQSDVDVWLYTRPIGGRMDRETARRHWAVVFQWQIKFATYEGMNIDGYNQPEWHEGAPIDKEGTEEINWIKSNYLGKHFLSPKDVNGAAKSNRINGYKYFAGHINCHYWAKVFAESLGFTVPQISADAEPFAAVVVSLYKNAC